MYARVSSSVLVGALSFSICIMTAIGAAAQSSPPPQEHQHEPQKPPAADPAQQHDMQHMHMGEDQDMAMPPARGGSGTSWPAGSRGLRYIVAARRNADVRSP